MSSPFLPRPRFKLLHLFLRESGDPGSESAENPVDDMDGIQLAEEVVVVEARCGDLDLRSVAGKIC